MNKRLEHLKSDVLKERKEVKKEGQIERTGDKKRPKSVPNNRMRHTGLKEELRYLNSYVCKFDTFRGIKYTATILAAFERNNNRRKKKER